MTMKYSELERIFTNADLNYKIDESDNEIITGMSTDIYKDKDGDNGVIIRLRLSEKISSKHDTASIEADKLKLFQETLENRLSKSELTVKDVISILNQTVNSAEEDYERLDFIIAPLHLSDVEKPPHNKLIRIVNKVNSKVILSKFYVDNDSDVIFLYQMCLDDELQKLHSKSLRRILGSIAHACDLLYKEICACSESNVDTRNSSQKALTSKRSNEAVEDVDDVDDVDVELSGLVERSLRLFMESRNGKFSITSFNQLRQFIIELIKHDLLNDDMPDEEILVIMDEVAERIQKNHKSDNED